MNIYKLCVNLLMIHFLYANVAAQNPYEVHQTSPQHEHIPLSEERQFLDENFPTIPMNKWKPGMKFVVPYNEKYDKRDVMRHIHPYKKNTRLSYDNLSKEEFKWKTFTLIDLEYRKDDILYLIFDCEGNKYMFKTYKSEKDFKDGKDGSITDLVYAEEIDKAKELLLGKRLYIMDRHWYNEHRTNSNYVKSEKPKKYYPVDVVKIGAGNMTDTEPVKIVFRTMNGNEFYRDIKFSNTNNLYGGKIEFYERENAQRNCFDNVFSFQDPYLKYSHISKIIWEKIQEGVVVVGMTEEECMLSWGKPKEINRSSYGSDQWVYSEQYLYFEDGKLVAFN